METKEQDRCRLCDYNALANTPRGRMCAGHALVEMTREWNQGNWSWVASFDSGLLAPPRSLREPISA